MSKINKIILLLSIFIFLTTYSPKEIVFFKNSNIFFFKIKNIEIVNNEKISKSDITKKLKHIYKKNILFISNNEIQKPLKAINFLEKIEVKKKYPNTIIIKIFETQPIAILIKNNKKYILDTLSNLIAFDEKPTYKDLPNVFGKGAESDFINFFTQLKDGKFPRNKVKSYYYFQINRWDLKLFNGQIIKFPNNKRVEAIQQSVELLNRKDFKNYKVIDLRISGKIVAEQ